MNRLIIAATGLSLVTPLLAQGTITSPKGGLTYEGMNYAYYLGRYADARYQYADGENKGNAHSITEVGYRLDNRAHTTSTAMGRSWTNVSLQMSETTNLDTMDKTWSQNISGAQTTVFSGKADWDSFTGTPLLKPDIWGGLKGKLRFPFSKPWVYSGKNDMLLDYSFQGGVLANAASWSGSRAFSYYLDGENISTNSMSSLVERIPSTRQSPACNDSAITYTGTGNNAYMYGSAYTYGSNYSTLTYRNKLLFTHYSYYTAPEGAPVMHVIGLAGSTAGVDVGARCNRLHVDLAKPFFPIVLNTLKSNTSASSGTMGYLVPWDNAMTRFDLHLQAAWNDSTTSAFSLTEALKITLPDGLPPDELPRRKMAYAYPSSAASATSVTTSSYAQPFVRYKTQ
ncbi:MAG: hypothetical protein ACYST0_09935 [Planctomycetota bacterium]